MKHFITLVLLTFFYLGIVSDTYAQYPSNCNLSQQQIDSFKQQVNYLINRDNLETVPIGSNYSNPAIFTDLFFVHDNTDSLSAGLYKVYQMVRFTPAHLNVFEAAMQGQLGRLYDHFAISNLDTNTTWVNNLIYSQFPTGETLIDSLNTYFGLSVMNVNHLSATNCEVDVQLATMPNLIALDSLRKVHGFTNSATFPTEFIPNTNTSFCGIYWDGIKSYSINSNGINILLEKVDCAYPNVSFDTLDVSVDYSCNTVLNSFTSSLNLGEVTFDYQIQGRDVYLNWEQNHSPEMIIKRINTNSNQSEELFTSTQGNTGNFIDRNVPSGMYVYYLQSIEQGQAKNLKSIKVTLDDDQASIYIADNVLFVNVSEEGSHNLSIYDTQGRRIQTKAFKQRQASFSTENLITGIYLVELDNTMHRIYVH